MKYFEEAKSIWKSQVPKNGQSDTIEGELIRAVEKLRYEAQNNGNGNWDEGLERFCEYIWDILNDSKTFESNSLEEIKFDIKTLLDYENPYLEDDLYDRITDRVVEWSIAHNGPISREKDPKQYR
ncbi:hypothetical protein ACFVV6_26855 [Bacillus mycoides]|uniref:Uncharacterized protein n=1 Tax=Bacillus mycoides TaxID=1405 RepID=A0AAP8KTM9_BACMY|nr:hypothetical protein [Bacillus mycoides]AJH17093.1 hypothetical protein BG05_5725 [Bacillus mycoides]EOO34377.1 hypothetical protein IKK_05636 [Bacillus mycoides]KMQ12945.1 hypothetical protein TU70_28125 [Bacillus mycoides]KUH40906.1 hypothetical protein M2E15_4968 [Bacillus mycoides]MDR4239491.1 hypothetical protein [Bacillus mycoides]